MMQERSAALLLMFGQIGEVMEVWSRLRKIGRRTWSEMRQYADIFINIPILLYDMEKKV